MSDRYETPSWDDEPQELGASSPVTPFGAESGNGHPEDAVPDLDASSENVLDGWPVVDEPGEDEAEGVALEAGHEPDEADKVDEPAEATAFVAAPDEQVEDVPPAPLADRLSASSEHAPGDLTVPPGYSVLEGLPSGERRAVGIVVARFNGDATTKLLESALEELDAIGVARESITVMPVPGAFELPLAAMALAKTRRFACIVALGCVIRGDTPHFDYVSSEAASGLQLAAIETGVPVAFGVLTLDRADQAESRYVKGAEAVRTGLEMADLFANLRAAAAR
jgi:6,7-dimethyl-8-ribityllumazine synthase